MRPFHWCDPSEVAWLPPQNFCKQSPFLSCPSHSVCSRDEGKQQEDWNGALQSELHLESPDWGLRAPLHLSGRWNPNIPTPSPQRCPRPFPTAPALPPATLAARAPPQPRGPGRPGGSPHRHTHTPRCRFRRPRPGPRPDPAADPAAPASHGPAEGPGNRRDPRPPRPGPPCPEANRRARSRVTSRAPRGARSPRAWAARSRRRRRAEVELTGSESPARGRKPASLGNVAAGANKRPRPAPSSAAGAPRGGGGVGSPALREPRVSHLVRRQPWWLEVDTFQKWLCFRVYAAWSKQILGICCRE